MELSSRRRERGRRFRRSFRKWHLRASATVVLGPLPFFVPPPSAPWPSPAQAKAPPAAATPAGLEKLFAGGLDDGTYEVTVYASSQGSCAPAPRPPQPTERMPEACGSTDDGNAGNQMAWWGQPCPHHQWRALAAPSALFWAQNPTPRSTGADTHISSHHHPPSPPRQALRAVLRRPRLLPLLRPLLGGGQVPHPVQLPPAVDGRCAPPTPCQLWASVPRHPSVLSTRRGGKWQEPCREWWRCPAHTCHLGAGTALGKWSVLGGLIRI